MKFPVCTYDSKIVAQNQQNFKRKHVRVSVTLRNVFVTQYQYLCQIGLVISLPLCGVVISSLGWQACFYMQGATGMVSIMKLFHLFV